MAAKKRKKLEATIALIHRRWSEAAPSQGRQARPTAEIPHIPTSFAELDQALAGIGGFPHSRLTELAGAGTSGITTVALKVITNAQTRRDYAAYVDLGHTFDPDYATRCEVPLERLLLVRPRDRLQALEMVHTLVASRGVGVLVFDLVSHCLMAPGGIPALAAGLSKLLPTLAKSPCALIFLTPLPVPIADFALPHASLRLRLEREQWLSIEAAIFEAIKCGCAC